MDTTKPCAHCGKPIIRKKSDNDHIWGKRKYCSTKCSRRVSCEYTIEKRRAAKTDEKLAAIYAPRYVPIYEEDQDCYHPLNLEQRQLDRQIDSKHNLTFAFKHIKPGDPEFEELCKKITPIERVKKTQREETLFAEIDPAYNSTFSRKESENVLR